MVMLKMKDCPASLSLHYKGTLCSFFPITSEKDLQYYEDYSNDHIIRNLRKGYNLKQQIGLLKIFVNIFEERRRNNKKVSMEDHIHFLIAIFALIKFKQLENNELNGHLILKNKKRKRTKLSINNICSL